MKHRSAPEFASGFLLASAIFALGAALSAGSGSILAKLCSQEAAGWAQAIGTVLAIWGTFRISNRQHFASVEINRETSLRKAKSLSAFLGPTLKTIEADIEQLILFCSQHKNIGVRNLRKIDFDQVRFRPIPSLEFLLSNAHNFPGTLSTSLPQLLGFRNIVDTNIELLIRRGEKIGFIDGSYLAPQLEYLNLMKEVLGDVYNEFPDLHDKTIQQLMKSERHENSKP